MSRRKNENINKIIDYDNYLLVAVNKLFGRFWQKNGSFFPVSFKSTNSLIRQFTNLLIPSTLISCSPDNLINPSQNNQ